MKNILNKSGSGIYSDITKELSEDGIVLSGGEEHKLGLARLFTGSFGLLVLDEPSSSLDPLAEYKLNELIFNRSNTTTTILVSHRLSNVRDADKIYLMKDGSVYECGTHDELMELKGIYYDMFQKQAEKYLDVAE